MPQKLATEAVSATDNDQEHDVYFLVTSERRASGLVNLGAHAKQFIGGHCEGQT